MLRAGGGGGSSGIFLTHYKNSVFNLRGPAAFNVAPTGILGCGCGNLIDIRTGHTEVIAFGQAGEIYSSIAPNYWLQRVSPSIETWRAFTNNRYVSPASPLNRSVLVGGDTGPQIARTIGGSLTTWAAGVIVGRTANLNAVGNDYTGGNWYAGGVYELGAHLIKSTDNGANWAVSVLTPGSDLRVNLESTGTGIIKSILYVPEFGRWYIGVDDAGAGGRGLYTATAAAPLTYSKVADFDVIHMAFSNNCLMVVGNEGGVSGRVFITTDGISFAQPNAAPGTILAENPLAADQGIFILATTGNSVFASWDNGASWYRISRPGATPTADVFGAIAMYPSLLVNKAQLFMINTVNYAIYSDMVLYP